LLERFRHSCDGLAGRRVLFFRSLPEVLNTVIPAQFVWFLVLKGLPGEYTRQSDSVLHVVDEALQDSLQMATSNDTSDSAGRTGTQADSRHFLAEVLPYLERMWLLFCFYTLSIGPMYWEWVSGREAKGSLVVAAFYEPLRWLGTTVPLFGEWLNWYVRLWIF